MPAEEAREDAGAEDIVFQGYLPRAESLAASRQPQPFLLCAPRIPDPGSVRHPEEYFLVVSGREHHPSAVMGPEGRQCGSGRTVKDDG